MSYSMLSGVSPLDFGAGENPLLAGVNRFTTSTTNAMNSGMKLGSALTSYGMQQRLAGAAERAARQDLNTRTIGSQNQMLRGVTTQQVEYCRALGGNSSFCQRLQMVAEGLLPPGAQNQPRLGDDDYRGDSGITNQYGVTGMGDQGAFDGDVLDGVTPYAGPVPDDLMDAY